MRPIIVPAIVLLLGLVGCAPVQNQDRNPANEAMVMKYSEAELKPDFDALEDFLSEDYKEFGPAVKDSVDRVTSLANRRKSWEDFSEVTYDRYGILSTTVEKGRVAGDWVLDWGKLTIQYKNGRPSVTIWYHAALKIRNGKICRQRKFYDAADMMSQQGYSFVPAEEKALH